MESANKQYTVIKISRQAQDDVADVVKLLETVEGVKIKTAKHGTSQIVMIPKQRKNEKKKAVGVNNRFEKLIRVAHADEKREEESLMRQYNAVLVK